MADELDNLTVSPNNYNSVKDLNPGERGLGLSDMAPSQWGNTIGTGLTPGARFGSGFGLAGSQKN